MTLTLQQSPVQLALRQSAIPSVRKLRLRETEQFVILEGTVSSYYLKQLSQETVLQCLGGRRLINRVQVSS